MGRGKEQQLKRTIKYLACCKNPEIISLIIANSADNVIKAICNAALNTAHGIISLTKSEKRVLSGHRAFIQQLIQTGESVEKKRKFLKQASKRILALLIPLVLRVVISSLGPGLFNK